MQIKFITVYYANEDLDASRAIAQADLLRQWQESLNNYNMKALTKADIRFTDWAILDYPEQERLKTKIDSSITKHYNHLTNETYWWFLDDRYTDFKTFYNDLDKTHQLMELVITVEDSDR